MVSPQITLWWTNIAMENHHFIAGKIHYFYGHCQLQTVSLPEGKHPFSYGFLIIFPLKPPFSYGFPMVFLWFSTLTPVFVRRKKMCGTFPHQVLGAARPPSNPHVANGSRPRSAHGCPKHNCVMTYRTYMYNYVYHIYIYTYIHIIYTYT